MPEEADYARIGKFLVKKLSDAKSSPVILRFEVHDHKRNIYVEGQANDITMIATDAKGIWF